MKISELIQPKKEAGLRLRNTLVALVLVSILIILYVLPLQLVSILSALPSYLLILLVAIEVLVLDLIIFAHDPIQYAEADKNKYTRFFTEQFPSKHIAEKNNVTIEEPRNLWFAEYNKWSNLASGNIRDKNAVWRLASGFLKLLFPDLDVSREELHEYCLKPAINLRQRIRNQLSYLDPEYKIMTISFEYLNIRNNMN